jgi:transposase
MGKSKLLDLTKNELRLIEKAISSDPRREVRQRATAVLMLHLGKPPKKVAVMLEVSLGTIYNWRRRWLKGGVEGLANRPKSGRPPKVDRKFRRILKNTLEVAPPKIGYEFEEWNAKRLRDHLARRTGTHLSVSHIRTLLRKEIHSGNG